jgi:Holliday junction resolvasome RuvABC ATP-dependent DNA helicase subunit
MKQGTLVRTSNVIQADKCIDYLVNRPKMEMVGLGLIYGKPGLGKTTYAKRVAFSRGYLYLRLEATTTPKSFATELLTALYRRFGLGEYIPYGTANGLYKQCLSILEDHENTIIVIDEIDYAFRYPQLLGAIRDIVDETLSIVILVGMQNAKDRLAQINEYYFDRCNAFYEFKPVTRQDVIQLMNSVLGVQVESDLVTYVHFHSTGNLRLVMKLMRMIEDRALKQGLTKVSRLDIEKLRTA